MTVGWLDLTAGVAGDMLLGALADLGLVDPVALPSLLGVEATVCVDEVERGPLRARRVVVSAGSGQPHRRLDDLLALTGNADVPPPVRDRAAAVFRRLAAAEASVHGVPVDQVQFHEVGAVDAVIDIVGTCLGLHALGADRLVASSIALGGGTTSGGHGPVPVPGPAVLALLASTGLAAAGGGEVEQATPTGVALVAEWADGAGDLPPMTVTATGYGAGHRNLPGRPPNVVRLVTGSDAGHAAGETAYVVEANVDDLDPRLWPGVLDRLLAAGAGDAWLTPILMKKGRPAYTVSVLTSPDTLFAVRRILLTETSTIGMREHAVAKHALAREFVTVDVGGQPVQVKIARTADGRIVNRSPEFTDVVAAADVLGLPVKLVLAQAAAAASLGPTGAGDPAETG